MRTAPTHHGRPVAPLLRPVVALAAAGACAVGLIAGPARADDRRPDGRGDREPRGALQELVRSPGGPPGAVALLQRGGEVEVRRAGTADTESGRPPRPGDHMRLASVSKAFSGAVALRLVDRGKLRLDDTIGERLPDLPRRWHGVTLRQMLQHTSGLPDFTEDQEFLELLVADPRRAFDSRGLLDFVADDPLYSEPGSRYRYSNSDNVAVALMAEAATGRPYEELLHRSVLRPLGLHDTGLPQGHLLPGPYLHGYDVEPGRPPEDVSTTVSMSAVWASGGMVSTPNDLNAFMRAYAGGALLSEETREQQTKWVEGSSVTAGPGRNEAGLALFRYTTPCGVVYGHTGTILGYTQFAAATPDGERSVTLSITTQFSKDAAPELLARLRAVQEDLVCELLGR